MLVNLIAGIIFCVLFLFILFHLSRWTSAPICEHCHKRMVEIDKDPYTNDLYEFMCPYCGCTKFEKRKGK